MQKLLRKRNPLTDDEDSSSESLLPHSARSADYYDDKDLKRRRQEGRKDEEKLWGVYVPIALTIISLWTRLYKISWANYVVWDEAHFGKFASQYLKREFYFDVHPPMGKMLLGLSGLLSFYNGSFAFESGHDYPPDVNYTGMRIFCALFGAAMVPVAYFTGINLGFSKHACVLLACMVMFDIATLEISRFILLDSMLLFFTSFAVYCLVVFRKYQVTAPFSNEWYFWMLMSGLSLGMVTSVKWVGLFAIALVGLHTIDDLWEMFGDLKMDPITYLKHWYFRICCLIIAPFFFYALQFYLHFWILNHSGSGDGQMSSLFQANLIGNSLNKNPPNIAFGSIITMKSSVRGGALLHSHRDHFPEGSLQQQVTAYHHQDSNNKWIIAHPWDKPQEDPKPVLVKHGDVVRLVHVETGKNLHSHKVAAPMTKKENEVSAYGNNTFGDENDLWIFETVDDITLWRRPTTINSLTTRFLLRHYKSKCLLRYTGEVLPQWGFKQQEVVCQRRNPDPRDVANMWNIESHWNDKLPTGTSSGFGRRFWKDFGDLNVAMWNSNNAMTPDPDKEPDGLTSHPWQWPMMTLGLRICGWDDEHVKFFLLGNPILWIGSTLSLGVTAILFMVYVVRWQRKCEDWKDLAEWDNFYFCCKVGFLGWFLHYIPFYIMGRVTYLHHYFPALYFALINFAFVIDHLGGKFQPWLHRGMIYTLLAVIFVVYLYFADFAFGIKGPASAYKGRRWRKDWNIYNA
ncbi:glycosyltransferase family 39 protein [Rhizoclosmatium globosum]|uniref:Dolichyl-phosphate-mannose--protein mannosyltransferase n=1 Tax=Rhizoclosmatium globosum TaxID=329046 RepID=A0A1Y2CRF5_9FUNG|nr:Protein O-mannosyltransferase 2 [Rhizoclosmatium hyalinum]ORY49618.1 glycosyltransferase family 39 protein [Rhizoclosmatium globosum]|eukprot:ORY49618.1 glycosyltransferase family 39 protein [Rhizoclosmatium globosum]